MTNPNLTPTLSVASRIFDVVLALHHDSQQLFSATLEPTQPGHGQEDAWWLVFSFSSQTHANTIATFAYQQTGHPTTIRPTGNGDYLLFFDLVNSPPLPLIITYLPATGPAGVQAFSILLQQLQLQSQSGN